MDRELWTSTLSAIRRAAARVGWHGGRRKPRYANWLIVAMYIWSVAHDRTLSWACQRGSYGALFRPRKLPSISQFTRRIKSDDCQRILQRVHDHFAQRGVMTHAVYIDGKPLPVSPVSKDRDAKRGKISGAFARGYKLHAAVNAARRIVCWSVMGLNEDEKTVARHVLLPNLPPLTNDGLVLADSHYDSAPLHEEVSEPLGVWLMHPLRNQARATGAFRARKLRQMPWSRRELVRLWAKHPELMRFIHKARQEIEGVFGVLTCTAGGLANLPAWVRGLARVRRWVGVKIILYNARLDVRETLAMEAAT
jgi:Transposase DDE domain